MAVTETDNVTILWDCSVHTDRNIKANKPGITIKIFLSDNFKLAGFDIGQPE